MTQYFTFLINEMEWNVTYFIAMRSFDASGSVSKVSNAANFRFRPPICPHGEYWAPCTCSCESTEGLVTSIYGDFPACPCEAYFYQLAHGDIYTDVIIKFFFFKCCLKLISCRFFLFFFSVLLSGAVFQPGYLRMRFSQLLSYSFEREQGKWYKNNIQDRILSL